MDRHSYLVTYDISCPKRWRKVYETMHAYGEHVQLSVFRCDLTPKRHVRLKSALDRIIEHGEDQVLIVKMGRTTKATLKGVDVLGRGHDFELPGPKIV